MKIVLVPLPLRTLGEFAALDPWNGYRLAVYTFVEYVYMPKGAAKALDTSQYRHAIAIRSDTGDVRMLPESLVELWRRGQAPPERIPALLQAIEPRIVPADRYLVLHQNMTKTVTIPLAAVFAVATLVPVLIPINGSRLPLPVAIAAGAGLTILTAAIFLVQRVWNRGRREEQMRWLAAAMAGATSGTTLPEGKSKTYLRLYFMILGIFLGVLVAAGGLVYLFRDRISASVSSVAKDVEMAVTITRAESSIGRKMTLAIPERGGEKIEVRIPAGVQEGTRLRLKGMGVGIRPAAGDLYLIMHIRD